MQRDRIEADLTARLANLRHPLDLLREQAIKNPGAAAVEFLSSVDAAPQVLNYAELHRESCAIAASLGRLGIGSQDGVAILLPLIPESVTALVAAASVAVAFPMNLFLSAEAMAAQLTLARARLVITIGEHPQLDVRQRLREAIRLLPVPPRIVELKFGAATGEARAWGDLLNGPGYENDATAPEAPGALVHTGGTTGHPKVAQLSKRNLVAGGLMAGAGLGWRSEDRVLSGLPLFHVGGSIDVLLAVLSVGGTVILPTALGMRHPAVVPGIWGLLERTRATALAAVPTSLAAISAVPREASHRLPHLRGVMTGGAPIAPDLLQRTAIAAGCPVTQLYGMTEASGIACAQVVGDAAAGRNVGRPVPLARVSLGNPGVAPAPGQRGEVFVSGPQCFQGYRTSTGVTGDGEAWIASGDLGEWTTDGNLRIVGRVKDIIIRGGHNIDPLMIEEAAMAHPDVEMAAAVGMPDEYAGELPVLFVKAQPGRSVDPQKLREHFARSIGDPPARPKEIFVVDGLPVTPFGKVARYRLRQHTTEHVASAKCREIPGFKGLFCPGAEHARVMVDFEGPAEGWATLVNRLARLHLQVVPTSATTSATGNGHE